MSWCDLIWSSGGSHHHPEHVDPGQVLVADVSNRNRQRADLLDHPGDRKRQARGLRDQKELGELHHHHRPSAVLSVRSC